MKARRAKAIFLGAVLAIACWVLVGQRAADPEITGKVTLKGTPPAEIPIQSHVISIAKGEKTNVSFTLEVPPRP